MFLLTKPIDLISLQGINLEFINREVIYDQIYLRDNLIDMYKHLPTFKVLSWEKSAPDKENLNIQFLLALKNKTYQFDCNMKNIIFEHTAVEGWKWNWCPVFTILFAG